MIADWTVLGAIALVVGLIAMGATSLLLSTHAPMAPLASAAIAGGTAAGLVLLSGRLLPAIIVIAGGLAAAAAGFFYDRAVIREPVLMGLEAVIAAAVGTLAIPLFLLRSSTGLALPAPIIIALIALIVVGFSMLLRRTDRLPGLSASIGATVAALTCLLAVWRDVLDLQTIWWLAALALVLVVSALVTRSRATPFGAAGTSYLGLTIAILVLTVIAFLPPG